MILPLFRPLKSTCIVFSAKYWDRTHIFIRWCSRRLFSLACDQAQIHHVRHLQIALLSPEDFGEARLRFVKRGRP